MISVQTERQTLPMKRNNVIKHFASPTNKIESSGGAGTFEISNSFKEEMKLPLKRIYATGNTNKS